MVQNTQRERERERERETQKTQFFAHTRAHAHAQTHFDEIQVCCEVQSFETDFAASTAFLQK